MGKKLCLLMCFVLVMAGQTVFAIGPIPGITVTASAEEPWGINEGRVASKTVDGSRMDETFTYHAAIFDDDDELGMWLAGKGMGAVERGDDVNGFDNPNPGTVPGIQWIRFEMPAVIEMDSMWVWNYNQYMGPNSVHPEWPMGHHRGLLQCNDRVFSYRRIR